MCEILLEMDILHTILLYLNSVVEFELANFLIRDR